MDTDDAFFAAFTGGHLEPARFDHRAHLRAAACALVRMPFLEACIAVRDGLTSLATRAGRPERYHETMTVATMALVADCLAAESDPGPRDVDIARLVGRHPLLVDPRGIARRYRAATWASDTARSRFRMPDAEATGG